MPMGDESVIAVEPGEQDLLAATQGQTRRVRPEHVNYAKRAKRVDVRKLKENIWRGLDIVVPPQMESEEDTSMVRDSLFSPFIYVLKSIWVIRMLRPVLKHPLILQKHASSPL